MENNVNRNPVGWRVAAREQFRMIGPRYQRELLVFMIIGTLLAVFGTINVSMQVDAGEGRSVEFPRLMLIYPFLLVFATLWPLVVWRDNGTSWRAYHQAMPIDRRVHDLARISMGGAWMFMAIALMVLLGSGFMFRADSSGMISQLTPWFWIGFFAGPATVYLGSSIVAIASKAPAGLDRGYPVWWADPRSCLKASGFSASFSAAGYWSRRWVSGSRFRERSFRLPTSPVPGRASGG